MAGGIVGRIEAAKKAVEQQKVKEVKKQLESAVKKATKKKESE